MQIVTKTEVNYANAIAFVSTEAASATDANFRMIASGAIAYLAGYVWAPKGEQVPAKDITAAIMAALGETADKARAGKTKRYEFAGLCVTVARHLAKGEPLGDGNPWGAELAQCDSLESGIAFLAARFGSVARSVAELAKLFGRAGRGGAGRKAKSLPETVESWLESDETGEAVDLATIAKLLAPRVSTANMVVTIGNMLDKLTDDHLSGLAVTINDVLAQRQRKAEAVADATAQHLDVAA